MDELAKEKASLLKEMLRIEREINKVRLTLAKLQGRYESYKERLKEVEEKLAEERTVVVHTAVRGAKTTVVRKLSPEQVRELIELVQKREKANRLPQFTN